LTWRIELFGGIRARSDDGTVVERFRTQRSALLLAYLAADPGKARSREELGELLWPDEDPERQRTRLRYELTVLRRALGPDLLRTPDNTLVSLASGTGSDVDDFEGCLRAAARAGGASPEQAVSYLEAAVSLYRGDLLPGFYDAWALAERDRLHERLGDALTSLYQHLDRAGHHEAARHRRREVEERFPERDLPPLGRAASAPVRQDRAGGRPAAGPALFGRADELRELHAWLAADRPTGARLLTVTGMGGVGKTRLAAEAARGAPVPVLTVPLAAVPDAPRLFEAVLAALTGPGGPAAGREAPEGDARAACLALLRGADTTPPVVLLLDNCEQIAGAGAAAQELLGACPALRCLATSRSPLGGEWEREVALAPLPDADALALFLDRARAARPGFGASPTPADSAALTDLCHRLDGLPLAVELAAARAAGLGAADLRAQLTDRLRFLKRDGVAEGAEAGDARHSSVRAALEWSAALLPPPLRALFARLSVFEDGFGLDAAAQVCGSGDVASTADVLDELRRRSLLTVAFCGAAEEEPAAGGGPEAARWHMLPLVREFAATLIDKKERREVRSRHAEFFASQAERARAHLARGEWASAGRWLRREAPALRAAAGFAAEAGEHRFLHRLVDSLANPLLEAGLWEDGAELLAHAEAAAPGPESAGDWGRLARVLSLRGALARRRGREEEARQLWDRSLMLHLVHGSPEAAVDLLADLAGQALDRGRAEEAADLVGRMAGLTVRAGDRVVEEVLRARLAAAHGDLASASGHADAARAQLRAAYLPSGYHLYAFTYLGPVYRDAGRFGPAEETLLAALGVARDEGRPFHQARAASELSTLYERQGDWLRAAAAYYVAREAHAELGSRLAAASAAAWLQFKQRMRPREDVLLYMEELNGLAWGAVVPILLKEV
jgi:predicted ATPase